MTFSFSALYELCCDFCGELETAKQESDRFLEQFHTEDRVRFSDFEQIKKQYLPPYTTLVSALLSSLERTDRLGLRLAELLESTDTPDSFEHSPRIIRLWDAYDQYRADLDAFLVESKRYFSNEEAVRQKGTAPLVLSTRTLIASLLRTQACFASNQ